MRVISILSRKGGAGKSALTLGLGSSLAAAGHRTLLVDLDPFNRTVTNLLFEEGMVSLPAVLQGNGSFDDASEVRDNLFAVAGSAALENISEPVVAGVWSHLAARVATADSYDYIVLDAPSGWHLPCVQAAEAALAASWGLCLIPVASSVESFESARSTGEKVAALGGEKRTRYVLTMRTPNWDNSDEGEYVAGATGVRWLKSQIPHSASMRRLASRSLTPQEDSTAWRLRQAFNQLAQEVHRLRLK